MSKHKLSKTFYIIAFVAILLGIGNIIFGNMKLAEHRSALSAAQSKMAEPLERNAFFEPTINISKQQQYITKLNNRISFYSVVVIGGKCFLILGGVFLVLGFLGKDKD